MSLSAAELFSELEKRGCRGAILPVDCARELKKEIASRIEQGVIGSSILDRYLDRFCYNPEEGLPGAKSVFIAAVPVYPTEVTFEWKGEVSSFVIPPTYVFHELFNFSKSIREMLTKEGYRVGNSRLPLKLLAARSGLGEYGRNNILYVPGMGSFHGLLSFYTDFPSHHELREARVMDSCECCTVCADSCPTGSIGKDNFVIRADRCLTFYNEGEGEMPGWLSPSWHNALVGCMVCQAVCPENSSLVGRRLPGEHFTGSETRVLLEGAAVEGVLEEKLERLCFKDHVSSFSRNLRLLFEAR